jgi:hypothetical protein
MHTPESLVALIREAFDGSVYQGDAFLQGSIEGSEPAEIAAAFAGHEDWGALDAPFLDAHYTALSFLSEAGFRYFLPAFLVADVRDELQTADPMFHLTNGFADGSMVDRRNGRDFVRRWGMSHLVNPRRYGATTSMDYARYRLSVFTREEAGAIVEYLTWRRAAERSPLDEPFIDGALSRFWRERAQSAPTRAMLAEHLRDEAEYVAALMAPRNPEG